MHLGKYNNSPSRKAFWIFTAFAIIFAIVVANLALSRVVITIHPREEKTTVLVSLTLDTKIAKPDLAQGIISGKIVESESDITKNITEVSTRTAEDFARGTVKIKNIWKKDFFLQAGAQLVQGESPEAVGLGPKNIFLLDHEVNVPANGEIEAAVTAKTKGAAGNIAPGKFYFLRMSKWNRDRIWAESEENFSGGEIEKKIVTESDINAAAQATAEKLGQQELEKMRGQIPADSKISPALTRVEILESRADVAPETQAENFTMFVRGKVSSIVFNEKDLKDTAIEKFRESVGTDREISKIGEDAVKYELDDISGNDGKAEVKVLIPAILSPKLSSKILDKKAIIGYNAAALRERYAKFPEIESIDVKFFPFWVKSVPSFDGQVNFEIKAE